MADPDDFQLKLKALSDSYAVQLPQKLEQIERAWSELPIAAWDEEAFQALHRMVHSLSGSGKTFGFAVLSVAARNLEDALQPLALAKATPDEVQRRNYEPCWTSCIEPRRSPSKGAARRARPIWRHRCVRCRTEHRTVREIPSGLSLIRLLLP